MADLVAPFRRWGHHTFHPGATAQALDALALALGTRLPGAYRDLLTATDGAALAHGLVTVWATSELVVENASIRFAGWFDQRHIFIGESALEDEFEAHGGAHGWGPDLFYLDVTEGDDPPVRLFHFTPTKMGVAAPTIVDWIALVEANDGHGAPTNFDWT